jgi:hypothetical protein
MNTKKQVSILILITGLMVSGIVYGDDPVKDKGTGTNSTNSGSNLGWQEKAQRGPKLVCDGIRITAGPGVGTSGITFSIGFSSNFTIVECCQPATLVQSWCNYGADDARCPD